MLHYQSACNLKNLQATTALHRVDKIGAALVNVNYGIRHPLRRVLDMRRCTRCTRLLKLAVNNTRFKQAM